MKLQQKTGKLKMKSVIIILERGTIWEEWQVFDVEAMVVEPLHEL